MSKLASSSFRHSLYWNNRTYERSSKGAMQVQFVEAIKALKPIFVVQEDRPFSLKLIGI